MGLYHDNMMRAYGLFYKVHQDKFSYTYMVDLTL